MSFKSYKYSEFTVSFTKIDKWCLSMGMLKDDSQEGNC